LRGGSACSPLVERMLAYCSERINPHASRVLPI
jgi:hypothetical protein